MFFQRGQNWDSSGLLAVKQLVIYIHVKMLIELIFPCKKLHCCACFISTKHPSPKPHIHTILYIFTSSKETYICTKSLDGGGDVMVVWYKESSSLLYHVFLESKYLCVICLNPPFYFRIHQRKTDYWLKKIESEKKVSSVFTLYFCLCRCLSVC